MNIQEYTKAHNAVGLYDATQHFGRVVAGGPDAIDLLHRMSTNDLLPLIGKYGSGSQTVLTTEKGRIIDHLVVLSRGDSALLVTSAGNEARVIEWLDKFVIMEDAKFTKASDAYMQYLVFGPKALRVVIELFGSEVSALENLHFIDRELAGAKVQVQRWHRIIESGWCVYAQKEHAEAVLVALAGAVASADGAVVSDETYNTIRIEAGLPEMPTELNEKHNPLETTLVQAVSWTKGCYIGQEVIARLDSYDKVQRHLMGITFASDVQVNGSQLEVTAASGEVIGEVTSVTVSPSLGKTIGLAFIKSAYANPDATVNVERGEATLVKLPFDIDTMSVTELPVIPIAPELSGATVEDFLKAETTTEDVVRRINELKVKLRDKIVILGHHYQREDIIQFADRTGDSFELARYAASNPDKEFIIFCGVHFMAETADVLSAENQKVILPDLKAGCSMSDMARPEQVFDAWDALGDVMDTARICPITYMNSSAAIKAFCGEHGGAVSTSSNNKFLFDWAFAQGFEKIFFFPDQHLGRNTAYFQMGIPLDEIVLYDQSQGGLGGLTPEQIKKAKIILWRGHCSVHQHFQPSHPDIMRALYPGIKILVHPECMFEVVQKADLVGSTAFICKTVETALPGSSFAIGTEHHLVSRLKHTNPDKFVTTLAPFACECATMYRISPEALLAILEDLDKGVVRNQIVVPDNEKKWARVALQRMLDITATASK